MVHDQSDLELALRHILEAEQLVAEQRARLERLRELNRPTQAAEMFLRALQETLVDMKANLAVITTPATGGNLSK